MANNENTPVVLVHGWGGSFKSTWQKPGIDALLNDVGRTVIGIDLLGHGSAEKPHDPNAYTRLPEQLLEQLPKDCSVDVAGFSLGALTVLRALISEPERFGKVVLAGIGDGVFVKSAPDSNKRIIDALEGTAPEDDTFAHTFAHYGTQADNDVLALAAIMKRPPQEPIDISALKVITNEICIVVGDKDFVLPADKLAGAFPNSHLVTLKNTDHFATTDAFSFIDVLLDFFAPT